MTGEKQFKISQFADVPKDWELVPLKHLIRVASGTEVPIEVPESPTAVPVFGSGPTAFKYTDRSILDQKAIIFGRKGTLGLPYVLTPPFWVIDTAYLATPKENVDFDYLAFLLRVFDWNPFITKTAKPSLVANDILAEKVPLPLRCEQQAIAAYLKMKTSEIDGLVAKLERERELLERYRRELIARTVTRGLNPVAPMRDSGIEWVGGIPEHWQSIPFVAKFSAVKELNTDLRIRNALQFKNGEIVEKHGWDPQDRKLDAALVGYKKVQSGMLVINGLNLNYDFKTKRVGMVRTNGVITSAYITLKVLPGNDERYLCYLLKSMDFRLLFHGMTEGVRKILSWADLRRVALPCPPVNEQTQIAEFLDAKMSEISSAAATIDRQIELLGRYRKQVINDVVTGKIRVGGAQ